MVQPSFETIVERHARFISRTLAHLGVPARDADDVRQEVLCGIARRLHVFDPSRSPRADENPLLGWIFGICVRQARSARRAVLKRPETLEQTGVLEEEPCVARDPETKMLDDEQRALLFELLAEIEPDRRAVITAYALEETPMADVAAALDIPINTAWNRLRLAMRDLRAAWHRKRRQLER